MNMLKLVGIGLLFATIVGIVAWRWQINGWGSLVWLGMVFVMPIIRTPHEKRNKDNTIIEKPAAGKEKTLLSMVAIGNSLLPVVHLATGALSFANYTLPHGITAIGCAFAIPGLYLFWRSHADLGRNWSVTLEVREDHKLVTSGIYKSIRHPMYSAIWLISLAVPFLIHNWIAGLSAVVTFGLLYFIRVPHEEQMMRQQFGKDYDDYCARSGRLWPNL